MMMVADLDEPFVPLVNGFLVDPIESRQQIESLLDILPSMFAENPYGEVAVGAVVKGVLSALVGLGDGSRLYCCLFICLRLRQRKEVS